MCVDRQGGGGGGGRNQLNCSGSQSVKVSGFYIHVYNFMTATGATGTQMW